MCASRSLEGQGARLLFKIAALHLPLASEEVRAGLAGPLLVDPDLLVDVVGLLEDLPDRLPALGPSLLLGEVGHLLAEVVDGFSDPGRHQVLPAARSVITLPQEIVQVAVG